MCGCMQKTLYEGVINELQDQKAVDFDCSQDNFEILQEAQ